MSEKMPRGHTSDVEETVNKIKDLSPHKKEQIISKLEMYSDPIPHPDILKKYDDMYPGAAKEIIDNGVQESVHRRSMESEMLKQSVNKDIRRDLMGFLVGILIIVFGFYLCYLGHTVIGTLFSGVSSVGLVSIFLNKDSKMDNNNQE